jgi:L-cysteine S-thiosulfotransferase
MRLVRVQILLLGLTAAAVSIPVNAFALKCTPKAAGYFQQMDAAARAAVLPRQLPGIAHSLTGGIGDPARGKAIMLDEKKGNCLMCHRIASLGAEAQQGNIGPNLSDVGNRLTEEQLRQRVVDPRVTSPNTIMPAFHVQERFARLPANLGDAPILSAAEVEDVVAYLKSMK